MGKYVDQSLGAGEVVKYTATVSLWRYVFNFLIGGSLGIVALTFPRTFSSPPFLIALVLVVWPFIVRSTTELVITDKRVIAKYGVISTQSIEIRFDKIETVRVRQGLLGRMLNYGDVIVTGTGSTFDPIRNISNAMTFRTALNQAIDPVVSAPR